MGHMYGAYGIGQGRFFVTYACDSVIPKDWMPLMSCYSGADECIVCGLVDYW